MGVRAEYDGLKIEPNIPSDWEYADVTRKFRGATYQIFIKRTGEKNVIVDGKVLDTNIIPSFGDITI